MSTGGEAKRQRAKLVLAFIDEVSAKRHDIDPTNAHNWYSLTLGWALAKGLTPRDAHEFACYLKYGI